MWSVATRVHNSTGYWGTDGHVTHTFCEPHYATTHYVAEFYNSMSSLIFVFTGLYVVTKVRKDSFVRAAALWLIAVGIGSVLFHGIMWYSLQLLDEIPMVGFLATLMLAKVDLANSYKIFLQILIIGLCIVVVGIYLILHQYEIFVHGITVIVLTDIVLGELLRSNGKYLTKSTRAYYTGLAAIVLGKVFWETENRLCEMFPGVWPLHVAWHIASDFSAYCTMVSTLYTRLGKTRDMPDLVFFREDQTKKHAQ